MAGIKDRYNSVLNRLNQAKTSSENKSSSNKEDRLERLYPKNIAEHKGVIRILPQKDALWFLEYKLHMFQVSSGWKVATCLSSTNREGHVLGDCPLCSFIEKNRLGKDIWKKIVAKNNIASMVFSYKTGKRYQFTYSDMFLKDILSFINENLNDEDVERMDTEGFDLYVGTSDEGWPIVEDVKLSDESFEELGFTMDEIEDLETVCFPNKVSPKLIEYMETMLSIFKKSFCPDLGDGDSKGKTGSKTGKKLGSGNVGSLVSRASKVSKSKPSRESDEDESFEELPMDMDEEISAKEEMMAYRGKKPSRAKVEEEEQEEPKEKKKPGRPSKKAEPKPKDEDVQSDDSWLEDLKKEMKE